MPDLTIQKPWVLIIMITIVIGKGMNQPYFKLPKGIGTGRRTFVLLLFQWFQLARWNYGHKGISHISRFPTNSTIPVSFPGPLKHSVAYLEHGSESICVT